MYSILIRLIGTGVKAIGLLLSERMTRLFNDGLCNSGNIDLVNVPHVTVVINVRHVMVRVMCIHRDVPGNLNVVHNVEVPVFAKLAMFPKEVVAPGLVDQRD